MSPFLFVLTITLHNIEEVLFLPKWSLKTPEYPNPIKQIHFNFAVGVITLFAYICVGLYVFYPNKISQFCYTGFLGSMIFNTFLPHLWMSIKTKSYCPGLLTGLLLIVPVHGILLNDFFQSGRMTLLTLFFSTLVIGVILLISLPLLFGIAKVMFKNRRSL